MPGICASLYVLALFSLSGIGAIVYDGALGVFSADFNDNFVNAAVKYDDWFSTAVPAFTGAIDSLPAEMKWKSIISIVFQGFAVDIRLSTNY